MFIQTILHQGVLTKLLSNQEPLQNSKLAIINQENLAMKNLKLTIVLLLLSLSTLVMAQNSSTNQASPANNTQAQPDKVPVGTIIENQLNIIEREFVGAAEAMPEDK